MTGNTKRRATMWATLRAEPPPTPVLAILLATASCSGVADDYGQDNSARHQVAPGGVLEQSAPSVTVMAGVMDPHTATSIVTSAGELNPAAIATVGLPTRPPPTDAPREAFALKDFPDGLCGEAFLGPEFTLDKGADLPVAFVDAAAASEPDGTSQAPFRSIADAIAHVGAPSRIYVAHGEYVTTTLQVPSGVRLFGGYAPDTWERSARAASLLESPLQFAASTEGKDITVLDGFEVHGGLTVLAGTRLILQHNVLSPVLSEILEPVGNDTHIGTAIKATSTLLRAQYNHIHVPAAEPSRVMSVGFNVSESCARIVDNHLVGFRTPFRLIDSDEAAINFNVITSGFNGFWLTSSDATLIGNSAQLVPPIQGCVYGLYLDGDSKPIMRGNEFHLQTANNRWVSEASAEADPVELVNNTLYLGGAGTTLYIDNQTLPDSERVTSWFDSIDQVNALGDIPTLGGNSATLVQ